MDNLALVGKVPRAGLVALRRMALPALPKLELRLLEALSENEIVKK